MTGEEKLRATGRAYLRQQEIVAEFFRDLPDALADVPGLRVEPYGGGSELKFTFAGVRHTLTATFGGERTRIQLSGEDVEGAYQPMSGIRSVDSDGAVSVPCDGRDAGGGNMVVHKPTGQTLPKHARDVFFAMAGDALK